MNMQKHSAFARIEARDISPAAPPSTPGSETKKSRRPMTALNVIKASEIHQLWSTTARRTCKCDRSHAPPAANHLAARLSWITTRESTLGKSLSSATCVDAALLQRVNWNPTNWTDMSASSIRSATCVQTVVKALWKSLIYEVNFPIGFV